MAEDKYSVGVKLTYDTSDLKKKTKEIEDSNKKITKSFNDVEKELKDQQKEANKSGKELDKYDKNAKATEKQVSNLEKGIHKTNEEMLKTKQVTNNAAKEILALGSKGKLTEKDMTKMNTTIQKVEQSILKSEQAIIRNKTAYNTLAQSIDKTEKELQEAKLKFGENSSQVKELEQTLGRMKGKYEELGQQIKINEQQLDSNKRSLGNVKLEIENINKLSFGQNLLEGMNKFGQAVDNVGKKIQDLGNGIQTIGNGVKNMGDTLTSTITTPLLGLGAGATATALTKKDAYNNIRIGTGATGEDLKALQQIFDRVYQDFPASMSEISVVIADLNTRMDLKGNELENTARQVLALSKITGQDGASSVEAISKMMKSWSVENKDVNKTLDMLFKTSQSTGIGVNVLASDLTTMSANLDMAGYELFDAMGMLGAFDKAGIDTNKMLKKLGGVFQKLADEGCTDFEKGLNDVFYRIKSGKTDIEKTQVAAEYFGDALAGQVVKAVNSGNFEIEAFTKSLLENGETIIGLEKETRTFKDSMIILKNKLSEALAPLGEDLLGLVESLTPTVELLIQQIKSMAESGQLTKLFEDLSKLAKGLLDIAIKLIDKWNSLDIEKQNKIINSIAELAAIGPVLSFLGDLIIKLGLAITFLGKGISWIGGLFGSSGAIGGAIAWITGAISSVVAFFAGLPAVVLAAIGAITIGLVMWVTSAIQRVWKSGEGFLTNITNVFKVLGQDICNFFNFIYEWIKTIGGNFKNWIVEFFKLEEVSNSLAIFGERVKEWFTGFGGNIKEKFTEIKNNGIKTFEQMIQGIGKVFAGLEKIIKVPLNLAIKLINSFTSGLNKIQFTNPITGNDIKFNIPQIPALAEGGNITISKTGNMALVGEAGPELVQNLGGRIQVTPLSNREKTGGISGALAGVGGQSIVINNLELNGVKNMEEFMLELNQYIRKHN